MRIKDVTLYNGPLGENLVVGESSSACSPWYCDREGGGGECSFVGESLYFSDIFVGCNLGKIVSASPCSFSGNNYL